jgi:hypothetical protein
MRPAAFTTLRAAARVLEPQEAREAALASVDAMERQWTAVMALRRRKRAPRQRVPCPECGTGLRVPVPDSAGIAACMERTLRHVTNAASSAVAEAAAARARARRQ